MNKNGLGAQYQPEAESEALVLCEPLGGNKSLLETVGFKKTTHDSMCMTTNMRKYQKGAQTQKTDDRLVLEECKNLQECDAC